MQTKATAPCTALYPVDSTVKYRFEKLHIRLVAHGGNHYDTIIVVEEKRESG